MSGEAPSLRAREILRKRSVDVLPDTSRLTAEDSFFSGLLEAVFLVAAADGVLSKEEVGSLIDMVSQVGGEGVTPAQLSAMVGEFSASLETQGRAARLAAISAAVTDPAARREVLGFASLVALCDGELAPSELFVLHSIGKAFELDAASVNGIVRSVKSALGELARCAIAPRWWSSGPASWACRSRTTSRPGTASPTSPSSIRATCAAARAGATAAACAPSGRAR
jgi:tellurite resistance protein